MRFPPKPLLPLSLAEPNLDAGAGTFTYTDPEYRCSLRYPATFQHRIRYAKDILIDVNRPDEVSERMFAFLSCRFTFITLLSLIRLPATASGRLQSYELSVELATLKTLQRQPCQISLRLAVRLSRIAWWLSRLAVCSPRLRFCMPPLSCFSQANTHTDSQCSVRALKSTVLCKQDGRNVKVVQICMPIPQLDDGAFKWTFSSVDTDEDEFAPVREFMIRSFKFGDPSVPLDAAAAHPLLADGMHLFYFSFFSILVSIWKDKHTFSPSVLVKCTFPTHGLYIELPCQWWPCDDSAGGTAIAAFIHHNEFGEIDANSAQMFVHQLPQYRSLRRARDLTEHIKGLLSRDFGDGLTFALALTITSSAHSSTSTAPIEYSDTKVLEWQDRVAHEFLATMTFDNGQAVHMLIRCAILEHGHPVYLQYACISSDWEINLPRVRRTFDSVRLYPPNAPSSLPASSLNGYSDDS